MASSMGFWAVFGTAVYPVGKVLLLCLVGAVLANHRISKFPMDARKHMNHMVFMVFTPALVFVNLGPAVTIKTLLQWWFMPFSVILNSVIGFALGHLVAAVTKTPPHLVRTVAACCTIGNMGNLPLVLIAAICSNSGSLFGAQCSSQGMAYASYGMLAAVVVMWAFIYNYLEPPEKGGAQHQLYEMLNVSPRDNFRALAPEPTNSKVESGKNSSRISSLQAGDSLQGDENSVGLDSGSNSGLDSGLESGGRMTEGNGGDDLGGERGGWRERWRRCGSWLRQLKWEKMVTPPVCGVIAAIVVGGTDPLQDMFFGAHAWFKLITDVITSLANAMIPCMMLVLGGNLTEGPTASELRPSTMIGVGCVRLVFLPVLGIAVMKSVDWMGLLPPDDPLFRFVLLLQFAMPTAINLGTVATMHGVGEKETSAVLFWSYLACTLTMPAFIVLFLYILI